MTKLEEMQMLIRRLRINALKNNNDDFELRMLDLLCEYVIIEERYNDGSHYTKDEHGRFTGSTSSGGSFSSNFGKIIKDNDKGMYRKSKPNNYIEPMPKQQFRKIKKAFTQNGGIIQQDEETDRFLKKRNVEGITYNSNTILMRTNPGRACVF